MKEKELQPKREKPSDPRKRSRKTAVKSRKKTSYKLKTIKKELTRTKRSKKGEQK